MQRPQAILLTQMIRILIPAYNEAENVSSCLNDISTILSQEKENFRLYVVNDGSIDKTPEILEKLKNRLPLVILNHPKNKGVSEAFRTGFRKLAKISKDSDFIILMEADGTSNPNLLKQIISKLRGDFDVVISSRYVAGGSYKNFPLRRHILSIAANTILKIFFPIPNVKDYTIFYRGYRAATIKKLIKKYGKGFIKTKNYVANAEILIKISSFTKKIIEIPFVYNYGRKKNASAMKILSNTRAYLKFIGKGIMEKF